MEQKTLVFGHIDVQSGITCSSCHFYRPTNSEPKREGAGGGAEAERHGEGEEGGQPPHVSHLGDLQVRDGRTTTI